MDNYFETYFKINFEKRLLEYFPQGVFAENSEIESNAKQAIEIIEELIKENIQLIVDYNRYSNLQIFKRNIDNSALLNDSKNAVIIENFNYLIGKVLLPDRFQSFFEMLSEEESETFLKTYFSSHEFTGQKEGIVFLVKSMMETLLNHEVKVSIDTTFSDLRTIPQNLISNLKSSNSVIGKNFIIGEKFKCYSKSYKILIGPIEIDQLNLLNQKEWCDGEIASKKLYQLVAFAEPYYVNALIVILLSRVGFKLSYSKIGIDKLGSNIS